MKRRNPLAAQLCTSKYRQRVVKPRKGKGSYQRRSKYRLRRFSLAKTLWRKNELRNYIKTNSKNIRVPFRKNEGRN